MTAEGTKLFGTMVLFSHAFYSRYTGLRNAGVTGSSPVSGTTLLYVLSRGKRRRLRLTGVGLVTYVGPGCGAFGSQR